MHAAYHQAAIELRTAGSVAVCAHVKPDGDAIGSVLALALALRQMGVPAVPTLADATDPPVTYRFLPGIDLFVPAARIDPPDVFVALDTPNLDRLGAAASLFADARTTVVLDHHPDNSGFGTVNVTDVEAAATGLMVWRLIDALGAIPTADIALCCWTALITDTGRFAYGNTTADALRDGAAMIDAGADPAEAHLMLYENRTHASLALEALVVSRIETANGGRVAHTWVAAEDYVRIGAAPDETEHLVESVRAIRGVEVAVLFRLHPDHVRVNLRAKTGFDVGSVARSRGGGGHAAAAGFTAAGGRDDLLAGLLPLLPGGDRA